MSLSLEDKLLGEKAQYYCSSSSEGEAEDDSESDEKPVQESKDETKSVSEAELSDYGGHCSNTGPKGVITDWREFKRLENERRAEQEKEKQTLLKKLSITCRSHLDDVKENEKDDKFLENLDKELEEFDHEFLKEYRKMRLEEMRKNFENVPKFGQVVDLTSEKFVEAVDKEKAQIMVIVHIYEPDIAACEAMNGCLICLAQEYPTFKFCKIKASDARLSRKFTRNGVPALLIYKGGELIGNFVSISNELGDDFYATDVESFLQEHGFLPNGDLLNAVIKANSIRGPINSDTDDSQSDFDVD